MRTAVDDLNPLSYILTAVERYQCIEAGAHPLQVEDVIRDKRWTFDEALARVVNLNEQRKRRNAHGTGCGP